MKTYIVTLKDGSDWKVKAKDRKKAIQLAKTGCARKIGQYFVRFNKETAYEVK